MAGTARAPWKREWRDASPTRRTQVLFAFGELLNARKDEIGVHFVTRGKVVTSRRTAVRLG